MKSPDQITAGGPGLQSVHQTPASFPASATYIITTITITIKPPQQISNIQTLLGEIQIKNHTANKRQYT